MEVIRETLLIGFLKTTRTKNERENERPRVSLSSIHIPPFQCELAERIASPHLCRRLQLRRRRLPLAVPILLGQVVMRHVQVQRASARDEPINLRRESTLPIVSRSFVRSSRSFVARAPGARACRRFRDDSPETRSIDRASLARVSRSIDAIAIDDTYFHRPFTRSSRASPPRARRSRAIERTCARLGVATR